MPLELEIKQYMRVIYNLHFLKHVFPSKTVGWCSRIHRLHLCRGVRPPPTPPNECPAYDIKQSDGEASVNLSRDEYEKSTVNKWLKTLFFDGFGLIWFGLWQISRYWLFNANPVFTYILNT